MRLHSRSMLLPLLAMCWPAAAQQDEKPSPVPTRSRKSSRIAATIGQEFKIGAIESGDAVYFSRSMSGRKAASGESLDGDSLTGAHALYPFGSIIRITNTANGKSVEVRVVDRISPSSNKVVSVSHSAAEQLEFIKAGSAQVKVELVALSAGR